MKLIYKLIIASCLLTLIGCASTSNTTYCKTWSNDIGQNCTSNYDNWSFMN